jgi:O-antigen/teichoic acid export membrane protein
MVLGLLMVPLTLEYIDSSKYGIWLTLSSFITWFNFFDIGLGSGLRIKLAEALAKNDLQAAKGYVSTTYALLIIIVSIVFILFIFVNPFLNWISLLNAPTVMAKEVELLAVIVFFFFCFRFVFGLIVTILSADQKLGAASLLDLFSSLLSIVGVYIVGESGSDSLLYLGITLSIAPAIVMMLGGIWLFKTRYRDIRPSFSYVNFSLVKSLVNLSLQFFILQFVVLLIFFSSNIIIAQLLNPEKVTEFNVVHKYFSIITTISILILNPYWSAATEAFAKEDYSWLKKSSKQLLRIWMMLAFLSIVMTFSAKIVYEVWVGDKIQISTVSSVCMGIYVIVLSWVNSFIYLINGIGKIRLQLYIYSLMSMFVIPISYFLIKVLHFGIEGNIIAMIVCLTPAAIVIPIQFRLIVEKNAKGIFNQ